MDKTYRGFGRILALLIFAYTIASIAVWFLDTMDKITAARAKCSFDSLLREICECECGS